MESNSPVLALRTAESVRETVNQDGAVLLDIKQGLCFSMNPVGARIWEMLKGGVAVEQIASKLEWEFHVPRRQVEAGLAVFLDGLQMRNLIPIGSEPDVERRPCLGRLHV